MENERQKFKKEFKTRIYKWVLRLVRMVDGIEKSASGQVIGKQLLRSGTSILANYVEAESASSKKDFTNFFNYSLKSANESKVWLSLVKDTKKAEQNEVEWLLKELIEISKVIAASILTLKGKR
ncbi:MAG: four helix bundle protein [Candidatus Taylorbacteria bacterium]